MRRSFDFYFQINRKRRSPMGQYVNDSKVLSIDVRAGWKSGTKITFAKEGDEKPGYHAGDIIFVIQVSLFCSSPSDTVSVILKTALGKGTRKLGARGK